MLQCGWAELESLAAEGRALWPWLDIELWWRDARGEYQLKSRTHHLARLSRAEAAAVLASPDGVDKRQHRYVARHSMKEIDIPAEWQTLLSATGQVAATYGVDNVRLVGFFE